MHITEDEVFEKQDFTINRLPKGDYDYCRFINCNFSESFMSEIKFLECEFIDCNLSSANITYTSFQEVQFKRCKMLGLHFENCNTFGLEIKIEDCVLDHSSFYQVGLKTSRITNSKCVHVDFTEADLSGLVFNGCDFKEATFQNSNLEHTDFRKATNYRIHPEHNKMKGAKFALEGVSGLLEAYQIKIE
ncbi:pentapeptide repeat-containing protein [Aestuariibaculum marinum]|uniref:Pentapeptide repeat-containing protein n=1 Tax=Aestuariibaculum marinum TaxID=2683592 RepID=A0A8J6PW80_9FLAO|nr:pentapeptide repeat-containing protein [Aestuariibaculum marinum]MBD0825229.1 pentapeptide repeat-containing protein [Aestuariibaculum marinum]